MDSLVDRFVRNSKFCITAKAGFGEEVDMSWLPLDSRLQEPLLLSKWLSPNYRSRAKAGEVSCSVVTLMRGTGSNRLLIFFRGTVAFLGGTITVQLIEVLLNVPERLGEHAVVAWINERIADKLGIGNPSITQVIEFASAWGPPAVIAAMGLSGWCTRSTFGANIATCCRLPRALR